MSPFDKTHIRVPVHLYIVETMRLSCNVFDPYRVSYQKFHFSTSVHLALEMIPMDFHQEDRVAALSCGVVCVLICLAVL